MNASAANMPAHRCQYILLARSKIASAPGKNVVHCERASAKPEGKYDKRTPMIPIIATLMAKAKYQPYGRRYELYGSPVRVSNRGRKKKTCCTHTPSY